MKHLALFFALSVMPITAMAQSAALNPIENPAIAPVSDTAAMAQPAPKDEVAKDEVAKDEVAKDEVSDRNCLKETGSRLAPRPDSKGRKCVNATGRAYTKEDMDRTGAIDLQDALRKLDPAVH